MLTFKQEQLLKLVTAIPADSDLLLVHDHGVYIMSTAQPVGQRTIVYAEGCHPENDPDWWETSRNLVGGDDFGEPIGTAADTLHLLKHAKRGLQLLVTETELTIEPY